MTQIDLLDDLNVWRNAVWTGTDGTAAGKAADFLATWTTTAYLLKGARVHVDTDHDTGSYEQIDAIRPLTASAAVAPTAPSASADSVSTSQDRSVRISVLSNDTLHAANKIVLVQPAQGQVYLDGGGTPFDVSDDKQQAIIGAWDTYCTKATGLSGHYLNSLEKHTLRLPKIVSKAMAVLVRACL